MSNISKDFSTDDMKITGLCGNVYGFSVNCDKSDVDDLLDIHKY